MSGFMDQLFNVSPLVVYLVVGFLVFAEAAIFVGFVLPGETAVLLGGVLAANGRVSLVILLAIVLTTAVVGDSVGYEVGRRFGPRVLASRLLRKHSSRLDGAREFLRTRGGWAVFIGRFTAFLRAVMPALAGTSGMPYRHFLAFNALGGIVWGTGVVLLGYFAGHSYAAVERGLGGTSAALLVAVVLVGLIVWHRRRRVASRNAS